MPKTKAENIDPHSLLGFGWGEYINEVIILLSIALVGIGVSIKAFRWE